jgi:hypothetical protein
MTCQTSCFWFATRAAGLKGSSRRVVADMARRGTKVGLSSLGIAGLRIVEEGLKMCREAAAAMPLISNGGWL